ncbi:D-alanyl-D-alanine dipeptidase [Marinobacter fuscus]|uniref:D-alanyl-D-alanine dipeptidase n=1 Tax=Marinobacter fuscus TaxID=2109942 RepID=A0A2T1K633_9GAMM|nr:M15 family metallopeptidase [Marinobacter fuscus]PSF05520.1 D-alanyl-D-alanine dipeptidase [Marinobacter fuscus]
MANRELVEMADSRVRGMPITDYGERLVDVASGGVIAYGPPPECPETEPFYRLLREGVVARLEEAQQKLPSGLQFRLYEGYRNPKIQQMLFDGQLRRMKGENPSWDASLCYAEAAKLASPLRTFEGVPIIPPHSTGGAVDIEIIDATGKPLDFGMELSDWDAVPPEICATQSNNITGTVANNRRLLVEILAAEGFVNYPREWWHFSYGDQYWAFATARVQALYGSVQEPIFSGRYSDI